MNRELFKRRETYLIGKWLFDAARRDCLNPAGSKQPNPFRVVTPELRWKEARIVGDRRTRTSDFQYAGYVAEVMHP